ncbi:MAG: hypothetical protein SD837_20105 [Candidatus Electrothrix scaldis]|nr:MAG: hypothetical protein SD837_20105 [Candidatus Electrothrix sp. GW3-3]
MQAPYPNEKRMVIAMKRILFLALLVLTPFIIFFGSTATARNLDLSTVPKRNAVQLTIYNSEDLTLVRETRVVSFKKGINPLQFSWANTLIDPTSVELQFPGKAHSIQVLDTTFPHDKPQMLYWNVASEQEQEAKIEISYFTSGISWSADYTAIANPEETFLSLEGFVRIRNQSGEEYENAQVRLVVGSINLVEKIAELAQISPGEVEELEEQNFKVYKRKAARQMMEAPLETFYAIGSSRKDEVAEEPKEVAKEGLGEYFIYTIEGTETIPNGWAKQLRSFEAAKVPIKVEYRYRPREYGDQLVRLYLLENEIASGLGTTPLPNGRVQVLRANGRGGLSFLTSHAIKYVPIGDRIELNLGADPEVVFELIRLKTFRDNIWMQVKGGSIYHKVGSRELQLDVKNRVSGWDEHKEFSQRIRNYTGKPIKVAVRRSYNGDVTFRSELNPKLHDYKTVEFSAEVPKAGRVDLIHEIITRNGHNAKQDRVKLEKR